MFARKFAYLCISSSSIRRWGYRKFTIILLKKHFFNHNKFTNNSSQSSTRYLLVTTWWKSLKLIYFVFKINNIFFSFTYFVISLITIYATISISRTFKESNFFRNISFASELICLPILLIKLTTVYQRAKIQISLMKLLRSGPLLVGPISFRFVPQCFVQDTRMQYCTQS